MKNWLFLFPLLVGSSLLAQTTPYAEFEVDSAASPRGGMVFYNTFIQTSLRKPTSAQAEGLGGKVILSGIVETDGHIADVNVMKSFRPDCDREAMRVFRLFNAWKPAQKNGQPVRQKVTMLIQFPPNTGFLYKNGARTTYFGSDSKVIADSSLAKYKQIAPIDTNGIPTGAIVVYESKGKGWKEYFKMPLIRRKNSSSSTDGKITYTVGNENDKKEWEGKLYLLDNNGTILREAFYQGGKRVGPELNYHPNGCLAEKTDELDDRTAFMTWYDNGQIRQIRTVPKFNPSAPNRPEQVTGVWDRRGNPTVKDGNGQAVYEMSTTSRMDTTKQTQFIEKGLYENGLKQGVWTGRYVDGSYFYQEQYDKGICQTGKALAVGSDTVRYAVVEQQPEFIGGMQALGQFLAKNLRYPVDAQRARAQGEVFVSFVINRDGRVDDVQVLKGVGFGADEEAARVVKATNGRWQPGFQRGQSVKVKYNLPINFTLQ